MDTKKSSVRDILGPGSLRQIPYIPPAALKEGQAKVEGSMGRAPVAPAAPPDYRWGTRALNFGGTRTAGRRSRKLGTKFNRCVKSVRKTVKARKGSTKESAAIAICTTSVLQTRGRTLKRYRKGRLTTQRRR